MLGTEPELVRNYVDEGIVRIIFWPVLNHGNPSVSSTVAMECAGQQDIAAAWELHNLLFENQRDLWSADMDYFVDLAGSIGLDTGAFATCYTGNEALDQVLKLDRIRQERGVFGQPIFDINGEGVLVGSQPIGVFEQAIEAVQSDGS